MREFNFETVFQILYKPLTSNTNIKKEELYRDIFLDLYLLTGRFREDGGYGTFPQIYKW